MMTTATVPVEDYLGWLHSRANALLSADLHAGTALDRDDLVSVGMEAMWRAGESYDPTKGALPSWLTMRAAGSMKDQLRTANKHEMYGVYLDLATDDKSKDEDLSDLLIRAYHGGEIYKAISQLTQRQRDYIYLRFWRGWTSSTFTREWGYDPRGVWAGAQKSLRKSLSHLQEV